MSDPDARPDSLAELLRVVAEFEALPDSDPDKHEFYGFLYMRLARASWRRADRIHRHRLVDRRRQEKQNIRK